MYNELKNLPLLLEPVDGETDTFDFDDSAILAAPAVAKGIYCGQ